VIFEPPTTTTTTPLKQVILPTTTTTSLLLSPPVSSCLLLLSPHLKGSKLRRITCLLTAIDISLLPMVSPAINLLISLTFTIPPGPTLIPPPPPHPMVSKPPGEEGRRS